MTLRRLVRLSLLGLLALPASLSAADFAACEARFAADPETEDSARCFYDAGKTPEEKAEAVRRVERLRALHPGNPWLSLYLGHLKRTDLPAAEGLYRAAAQGFAGRKEAKGEISARAGLQLALRGLGRPEEAAAEARRAFEVGQASGDPILLAMGEILLAEQLRFDGQDLERAYLLLRRAESALFPEGPYPVQRNCLNALANVCIVTGRQPEAREAFRRFAALAAENGDRFGEAAALYGLVTALWTEAGQSPTREDREEMISLLRRTLAAAEASGHRGVESKASWILGQLTHGEEALAHFDRCLATAAALQDKSLCLSARARGLAAKDPRAAREALGEALDLARQAADPWSKIYSWRERMRVSWAEGPTPEAIGDAWAALEAIEAVRDQQEASESQAGLASSYADNYSWFAGRLLEASQGGRDVAKVSSALHVLERLRARTLLDSLEAARAAPPPSPVERALRDRRAGALEEISMVQRRLLDPDLPRADWVEARRALSRLELEEEDLRHQLARISPASAALRRPEFQPPDSFLGLDEALLSFQLAPWKDVRGGFGGGSWLVVSTHEANRVYRLGDRAALRNAVSLFNGLLERRDGSEAAAAPRLYRDLLATALDDLPSGVRRLVIVPDDDLHRLPFGALRAAPGAEPLAARYQISVVPSSTLWLRWRRAHPAPPAHPALALADPPMPGLAPNPRRASGPVQRAAVFSGPVRLPPLPHARREGRAVVRHLGEGGVLRLGGEASEAFVKRARLSEFGVVHFATHAVTDETAPERSGVMLAPGAPSEDGLLQIREIVDLDLGGRVVTLSACSGNAGAVLRGEGVMSLARAFFQAGAHTVVASLWPLRDDEAAEFFDRYYRHLGRGLSVAEALSLTQRDLLRADAPAAAWAGLVALGDGALVPLPAGRPAPRFPTPAGRGLGVAAALLTAVALAWLSRRTTIRRGR